MQTKLKMVLSFAVVASVAAVIYAGAAPAKNLPTAAASRALYTRHCAECHGNDGKSQTSRGRETEASDISDPNIKNYGVAKLGRIISNGRGEMPGFKRKLSSSQIASIARYIKTL